MYMYQVRTKCCSSFYPSHSRVDSNSTLTLRYHDESARRYRPQDTVTTATASFSADRPRRLPGPGCGARFPFVRRPQKSEQHNVFMIKKKHHIKYGACSDRGFLSNWFDIVFWPDHHRVPTAPTTMNTLIRSKASSSSSSSTVYTRQIRGIAPRPGLVPRQVV